MTSIPSRPPPFLSVVDYTVETEPAKAIVLLVGIHEGKSFGLYFEASMALRLSGDLDAAYRKLQSERRTE